jgi:aryl-alcohol dehydrogenase-like predicted oxidoreductase
VRDVDRLVCGTAALGLPYGLPRDGGRVELMAAEHAQLVIERALAAGLRTFDTAPAYGEAEARLGKALDGAGAVWTKTRRADALDAALASTLMRELDASLSRLNRAAVDLLQWHNWTSALAANDYFRRAWQELSHRPAIKALGASTYGPEDAVAAVTSGLFAVVQIEWNLLNQRVLAHVAHEAAQRGVKIALRSVFLQGALSGEGRVLPAIPRLREGVRRAQDLARGWGMSLAALALRAALDAPGVDYVLVGLDSAEQAAEIRRIAEGQALGSAKLHEVTALDLGGDPSTDPRTWP